MAEINITEKKHSWVPWALGVIVLAALIWFMSARNDTDPNTAQRPGAYDSGSAAGTLAPPPDSAVIMSDTLRVPPPR